MRRHKTILLGLFAVPILAAAQTRPPDAHDIRRERGDIVTERGLHLDQPATRCRTIHVTPDGKRKVLSVGMRLPSKLYSVRYRITEPGKYRLSAAPLPSRWIAYGPDAVLVSIRSGRVLKIVANGYCQPLPCA